MIKLKIVTPHGVYQQLECKSIHLTSVEGELTLLTNHMPIVAAIEPCVLKLVDANDQLLEFAISTGFCHLDKNEALLLADAIEGKGNIDLERAQKAYRRAKERIEKRDVHTNMRRAELSLKRAISRIQVYNDYK